MIWKLEILRRAQKQLARIPNPDRQRIYEAIQNLIRDPRPPGCKKLKDSDAWRIRIGDYRVIYEIHDEVLLVLVLEIGHRREVYR